MAQLCDDCEKRMAQAMSEGKAGIALCAACLEKHEATREVFQPWRKFKPDEDGTPHCWIQWKGTDVCMDLHCKCGALGRVDADFAYAVKCGACGQVYEMSGHIEAHPVESVNHECVVIARVEGHEAPEDGGGNR